MAYFSDLSPHTYTPTFGVAVVNVGWLDEGNSFTTGLTSDEFREAILKLCQEPVLLHRGFHKCYFCQMAGRRQEQVRQFVKESVWLFEGIPVGNGQIRILGSKGVWYSAPTLVIHYVVGHQYLPADEFIEAVISPVDIATKHSLKEVAY